MKKRLYLICGLALVLGLSAFAPAQGKVKSQDNPLVEEFGEDWRYVNDLIKGSPEDPRSDGSSIALKLMVNANLMELHFNRKLGQVFAILTNGYNEVVSTGVFDAVEIGSAGTMYMPSVNGEYTLTVVGYDYQGEVFYIIRR